MQENFAALPNIWGVAETASLAGLLLETDLSCSGAAMKEQDLLRIVRNLLGSVVDLMDSNVETEISAVLRNMRDGTAGFCSLLDEVIINESLEDLTDEPEGEET